MFPKSQSLFREDLLALKHIGRIIEQNLGFPSLDELARRVKDPRYDADVARIKTLMLSDKSSGVVRAIKHVASAMDSLRATYLANPDIPAPPHADPGAPPPSGLHDYSSDEERSE